MSESSELTPMQQAALDRINDIEDELAALDEQFDYQSACDPSIDSSPREMELFETYERLLMERSQLRDVVDGDVQPWVS